MISFKRLSALFFTIAFAQALAQNACPQFMLDSAMVVNVEGRFVNVQQSRASLDIEWRHHPESQDSFFVNLPDRKSFVFVTAGDYRFLEYRSTKVKRQLGLHHLRDNIGNTPLKLDDLELLANGLFMCQDTTKSKKIFSTAFSNMWWSMVVDTLPRPQNVVMRGARKELRTFRIGAWKDFSGAQLPTLVSLESPDYSGSIWVRSAYPIVKQEKDPLLERAQQPQFKKPELFRKTLVQGERKIPLILKLNQELLRE